MRIHNLIVSKRRSIEGETEAKKLFKFKGIITSTTGRANVTLASKTAVAANGAVANVDAVFRDLARISRLDIDKHGA